MKMLMKEPIYEENPWDDMKDYGIEDFKEIKNLLLSKSELKKADIIIDGKLQKHDQN